MFKRLRYFAKHYFRVIILTSLLLCTIGMLITSLLTKTEPPKSETVNGGTEKVYVVETIIAGKTESFASTIARIENKNEITLKALNMGIVKNIEIKEGDNVTRKSKILELDESYNGNTSSELQIEIAEKQLEKAKENENNLKNEYNDKKNLAEETYDDFLALLELNKRKIGSLKKQMGITDDLKDELNELIDDYEKFEDEIEDYYEDQDNDFLAEQGILQNRALISNYNAALSQFESTIINLKDQIDQLEYQTGSNYPGSEIAEINRDLTIAQLKFQQDEASIEVELSELNLELLKLQKDLLTLRSPVEGRVEKILVKKGELLTAGQEIAIISGKLNLQLHALISADLIRNVDSTKNAKVILDSEEFSAKVEFLSSTPVENGFFEIILKPQSRLSKKLTPGNSVKVQLELKKQDDKVGTEADNNQNLIYLPLDTVFKTNIYEYVLIAKEEKAILREVKTGEIIGDQIQILEGIEINEEVINDRRIIPNQKIALKPKS